MNNICKTQTFEEYLRELESSEMDRQTDKQTNFTNIFQLCWKDLKSSFIKKIREQ